MVDFLEQKRREIDKRLNELKPLVDEYNRLQAAVEVLGGIALSANGSAAAPARRGPGRPRGLKNRQKAAEKAIRSTAPLASRRGRRSSAGTRAAQALATITEQPGITVPELADKMKVHQTYLYKVLSGLQKEDKIVKQGRGWYPHG
ncbi:MAG: hypothetical protein ACTHM1_05235 [Solirubrobacteraceae bacterium]